MAGGVSRACRQSTFAVFTGVLVGSLLLDRPAVAQPTTVVLNTPNTHVLDTMLRNGPYATVNQDGPLLLTRFSTIPEWERRTVLAIQTTSIPTGSTVTSAVLTLTIKSGLGTAGSTRPVKVYRLLNTFTETQATWRDRQTGVAWATAGGDLGEDYGTVQVTNTAKTRIAFDVKALVQKTINGDF